MKLWQLLPLAGFVGLLGACQPPPDTNPHDLPSLLSAAPPAANTTPATGAIEKAVLVPGGNYYMVTVRKRADRPDASAAAPPDIMCTAPSPDWATAYSLAQQIAASGGVAGHASGSLSASSSTAETISMMVGRSAGVVALRDGLYNACQAYANGVIGKDAYALILSQYGNLLVALAGGGGGGGTGSGSTSSSGTPSGVAVAVSTGATPSGSGPSSAAPGGGGGGGSQAANAQVAQMQQEMMQAMFVSCISENDRTLNPDGPRNRLLATSSCDQLITDIVGSAKALLTPAPPPTGGNAAADSAKPAAKPDKAITALQTALKAAGVDIQPDGYWGPNTLAALEKYQSSAPPGLKLSKP